MAPSATPTVSAITAVCRRHYPALAASVLGLTAFNLTFRLGSEVVTEWDESLYAVSAWEMFRSGDWIRTTFLGTLDYSNVKPPLNVWLIAFAFRAFGVNLVALRLASALSALLSVAVLQMWARKCFGPVVSLFASLMLGTTYAFLYVHSGRSGNGDALLALLILLTVVTLWAAHDRPRRRIWLGPIAAAVFLLKGMAVLWPLALILLVDLVTPPARARRLPTGIAVVLFIAAVAPWAILRWQVDEWRFFSLLFGLDFIGRTVTVLDGHGGGNLHPLYYLIILQKYQYDWLILIAVACLLFPVSWSRLRLMCSETTDLRRLSILVASWIALTLLVPTILRTKLPWYLNAFYPALALCAGAIVAHGAVRSGMPGCGRQRRALFIATVIIVFGFAEARLIWYSYRHRDLGRSIQGVLIDERERLTGHRVFQDYLSRADMFVVQALAGAEHHSVEDVNDFLRRSAAGDYLLAAAEVKAPGLVLVESRRARWLYRRE